MEDEWREGTTGTETQLTFQRLRKQGGNKAAENRLNTPEHRCDTHEEQVVHTDHLAPMLNTLFLHLLSKHHISILS